MLLYQMHIRLMEGNGASFQIEHKIRYMSNTKITEGNLSEFVYRLFHEDFSPLIRTLNKVLY